jgi:RND superfamily putative drug exporter
LSVRWTTVDASSLPGSAQAYQADETINRSSEFVRNGGTPFYVVLRAPLTAAGAAAKLAADLRHLAGVRAVAPPRPLRDDTWQINLIATDTPYSAASQTLVRKLAAVKSTYPFFIGGDAAAFGDERDALSSRLPLAVALLAAATLVILFLLSGSLVAPLLALLMNALTLAAAFGSLILIFQDGRLESLLGYTSHGALDLTIPLVLAALVFAISTDYGVFLLSRVREARLQGQSDREAISGGVATVGRIVTSAAILFAVSIGVFGISHVIVLKILGFGTALAVLADSLLIRCLLLPATLALLGHRAWWLPSPLMRLHRRIGLREELSAIPESPAPRVTAPYDAGP